MTVGTESTLPENNQRQNPSDPLSPKRSREVPGRYIVPMLKGAVQKVAGRGR